MNASDDFLFDFNLSNTARDVIDIAGGNNATDDQLRAAATALRDVVTVDALVTEARRRIAMRRSRST